MNQRKKLFAAAAVPFMALSLLGQAPQDPAADPPAAPAVRVANHSSRWSYPREVTPGPGQDVYFVKRGDTLWDLGARFLGNPFAWPQIWELNGWVKDPHWIYPGDPLLIDATRRAVAETGKASLAPDEVANLNANLHVKPYQQEFAFTFQDFIQMPYLVPDTAEAYFKQAGGIAITGKADFDRDVLADGDVLYLGGGQDQGLKAGDRLVVSRIATRRLFHPDDRTHRKPLGDVVQQNGVIRVTTVHEKQSEAVIEHSVDGISVGNYALPYTEPARLLNRLRTDTASPVPLNEPLAKVVYIRMDKALAGGGEMVIVDKGLDSGLHVGDVLLTARQVPLDSSHFDPAGQFTNVRLATSLKGFTGKLTNFYLGQLMVVRADATSATCRILRSQSELMVGDVLTR